MGLAAAGKSMSAAEASATKLYCARAATECAMEAVQIMGGNGYMQEYRVEMLARDAKLLQIGGGTDEIQIINIARHLLSGAAA
jgi:alkylation response protein AidB-like acyl-CoA dehydrogenase